MQPHSWNMPIRLHGTVIELWARVDITQIAGHLAPAASPGRETDER